MTALHHARPSSVRVRRSDNLAGDWRDHRFAVAAFRLAMKIADKERALDVAPEDRLLPSGRILDDIDGGVR